MTRPSPRRRGRYEIVYIDPPWWRTPCGTAKTPYKTMTWEELHAFDLGRWLAPKCVVFCWTTGPTHLKECAVLNTWCERFGLHEAGIAYKWIKTRRDDMPELPPGYTKHGNKRRGYTIRRDGHFIEELSDHGNFFEQLEDACDAAWQHWGDYYASREWSAFVEAFEQLGGFPIGASGPRPRLVKQLGEDVIALTSQKNGRVFPLLTEKQSQWVFAPKPKRDDHSSKPPEVRRRIEKLLGDRPRIELFSRERVEGWDGWGDEYPGAE